MSIIERNGIVTDEDFLHHSLKPKNEDIDDVISKIHIADLIKKIFNELNSPLERITFLRAIVFGEYPHDIAYDLGVMPYRIRVSKARALQRIRTNKILMEIIAEGNEELMNRIKENNDE